MYKQPLSISAGSTRPAFLSFSFHAHAAFLKTILCLALAGGLWTSGVAWGQSVGDYRSVMGGDWATLNTWERLNSVGPEAWATPTVSQGYPGERSGTGTVTIQNMHSVTLNVSPANAIGSLVIGSAATSETTSLSFNADNTLNVSGDVIILATMGGNAKQISVNAGVLNIGGNLRVGNGAQGNNNANRISRLNISTGTVTVAGNLSLETRSDGAGNAAQAQIVFSGAGTLSIGGTFILSNSLGTLTPSSGTVNFNSSSIAQTIPIGVSAVTYNNLNINNTHPNGATLSADVTDTNVTGSINVQSGTLNNGGFAISLGAGGSFSVSDGATFNLTGTSTMAGGGTKTFGPASTVHYSGTAQTVTVETYGNLTLSGSGAKTFGGNTTIAGALTINSTAVAGLPDGSISTAATLLLDGNPALTGSWGSAASAATNKTNTYFLSSTTGIVNAGGGSQVFTSSDSFTAPDGVTNITVQAWGGGGAGGGSIGSDNRQGGGGGGGAYTIATDVPVTPGMMYNLTIGAGGTASTGNGAAGGTTTATFDMSVTVSAAGGNGGTGASGGSNGTGGSGGIGGTYNGGNGAGGANMGNRGGGGSSAGIGSNGNNGSSSNVDGGVAPLGGGAGGAGGNNLPGTAGSPPGGGGGGGERTGGNDRPGGAGADGQVIITWVPCPTTYSLTGTAASSPVCVGNTSTVTLTNTTPANLPVGTYTVTYNLSAPNETMGATANITVLVAGTGTFTTPALLNNGATTITITNLASGSCSWAISTGNTAVIAVNTVWTGAGDTDWNNPLNWCDGVPTAATDVTIPSAPVNQPVIGMVGGLCRNITIDNGATLSISESNALSVSGNWTNNGAFIANSSSVDFNGVSDQVIGGGTVTAFNNLHINNTGGEVILDDEVVVSGELTLTSGILTLGDNNLTIAPPGSLAGGSAASYIRTNGAGVFSQTVPDAATITFPVGNSGYNPATLTPNGGDHVFGMRVLDKVSEEGLIGAELEMFVVKRTWDITSPTFNVSGDELSLTFQWNDNDTDVGMGFDPMSCYVSHYVGGVWDAGLPGMAACDMGVCEKARLGITSLSPFAVASNSALPITLLYFKAEKQDEKTALLTWATATELNNDYMAVERSHDGQVWKEIGRVSGAGTTTVPQTYSLLDENPLPGLNYYRLRQVDYDGAFEYFNTIVLDFRSFNLSPLTFDLFPNPAGDRITLRLSQRAVQDGELFLLDMQGRVLQRSGIPAGLLQKELDLSGLPVGMYLMRLRVGGQQEMSRFVKE